MPKLSINATSMGEESSLINVPGAVGVVSLGAQTFREASARCCIGGNFSLTFDSVFVSDIDLDDNGTRRGDDLSEALEDVIMPGITSKRRDPRVQNDAYRQHSFFQLYIFCQIPVPAPNFISR